MLVYDIRTLSWIYELPQKCVYPNQSFPVLKSTDMCFLCKSCMCEYYLVMSYKQPRDTVLADEQADAGGCC